MGDRFHWAGSPGSPRPLDRPRWTSNTHGNVGHKASEPASNITLWHRIASRSSLVLCLGPANHQLPSPMLTLGPRADGWRPPASVVDPHPLRRPIVAPWLPPMGFSWMVDSSVAILGVGRPISGGNSLLSRTARRVQIGPIDGPAGGGEPGALGGRIPCPNSRSRDRGPPSKAATEGGPPEALGSRADRRTGHLPARSGA